MTAARDQAQPRTPVVLPVVRIEVDNDERLQVAIDRDPYAIPEPQARLGRAALRAIVDDITRRLGPVRVAITESDGTVFTDLATPPTTVGHDPEPPWPGPLSSYEVAGTGFLPEEQVAVALIVAHQPARADGTARLRLPPAVLAGHRRSVVLLGRTSGAVAWGDAEDGGRTP